MGTRKERKGQEEEVTKVKKKRFVVLCSAPSNCCKYSSQISSSGKMSHQLLTAFDCRGRHDSEES